MFVCGLWSALSPVQSLHSIAWPSHVALLTDISRTIRTLPGIRSEESIATGNDQIEGLVSVLEREGVIVRRPEIVDWTQPCVTPAHHVFCSVHIHERPGAFCNCSRQ